MATLRPQNKCNNCCYVWYPRGRNISLKCPNCGSNDVEPVGLGCFTQIVVYTIIGILVSVGIGMLDGEDAKDVPQYDDMRVPSKISEIYQPPKDLVVKKKDPHVLMYKGYSNKELEGCKAWANAHPLLAEKLKPGERCFLIIEDE